MTGTGMTGTGRVMCCDASLSNRWRSPPTSIFDETTNATRTRRRRRSRSTETRTLWCHFDRTSLFSIPLARVLSRRIRAIPAHPRFPPGGASRFPRRLFFVGPSPPRSVGITLVPRSPWARRPRVPSSIVRDRRAIWIRGARRTRRWTRRAAVLAASSTSSRADEMAAASAGAGLGSGSLNATARGWRVVLRAGIPGDDARRGDGGFLRSLGSLRGGGGVTGLAAGPRATGRGRGKTSDSCEGDFRSARARRSLGGSRGVTGRDADAPRWAGRRGRGSSSPRWGPGSQGVTHLLFERRGSGDEARRVSVGKASRKTSGGRGAPAGGRVRRAGDAEARFEPLHRHPLRDAAGTLNARWRRDGRQSAREGGGRGEEGMILATRRRAEMSWIRSGRVCAYRLARASSGSSRGAARRLLLPFERAADGSEDVGGVR